MHFSLIFSGSFSSVWLLIPAILWLSCSLAPLTGGSDLPNGRNAAAVSGTLFLENGERASNTLVRLVPDGFDPVTDSVSLAHAPSAVTDSQGKYTIQASDTGKYTVLAVHAFQRTRGLVFGVHVNRDSTKVQNDTLQMPGSITVTLSSPFDAANGYFFIPGTTIYSLLTDNSGHVTLDSVPANVNLSLYYAVRGSSVEPHALAQGITVSPGGITTLAYPGWIYSRKLFLNTTGTGANVTGKVMGFPVLVRLTGSTFDFLQAKGGGEDIRFTKSDGSPLPYEIERWDASQSSAEIWVKIDTVYGNDSTRFITMHWGKPDAADESNGAAVFDAGATGGFEGVWHCGTDFNDATVRNHNGTNHGTVDAPGIIGTGKKFNGASFIKIPGLMDSLQTITISAWAKLDTPDYLGAEVISIGDAVLIRMDDAGPLIGTRGAFQYDTTWSQISSGKNHAQTGWHYLSYSIDGSTHVQTLSIDGAACATSNLTNPVNYSFTGTDTYIGKFGFPSDPTAGYYDFIGTIDEVRVCSVARSSDWIKLCYMNQRADDRLIRFQ
jgi:hypothetical protein